MKFSASMIKTWMECPKKAHFKDILDIPEGQHAKTTFGTCVHDALELFNDEGNLEAAIERFKTTWADPSILDNPDYPGSTNVPDVWPPNMDYNDLLERGIEDIKRYADENKWSNRKIVASEHKFLVPFGEHELSGIVDSLEITGRGQKKKLDIIDFKTSAYLPKYDELRLNIQFTIYMYASTQEEFWEGIPRGDLYFGELMDTPRRGLWYSLWHHKMRDVGPRGDEDLMRLYRAITEIERAIEYDVYVPNISGDSCMWCPYTRLCGVTIPVADQIEESRNARIRK